MIAALKRWAAFLQVVHGRAPLVLQRREPVAWGDVRLAQPNHYPAPQRARSEEPTLV